MATKDVGAIVDALVADSYEAEDALAKHDKATKTAIRKVIIERLEAEPSCELVAVLAHVGDDSAVAALEAVIEAGDDPDGMTLEAIPEALATIGGKRATAAILALVDHDEETLARTAMDALPETAATVKLLVDKFDAIAAHGEDLRLLAAIEKLVAIAPADAKVIAAFARNWDFTITHAETAMASNAMFDALIEHAATSKVARAAFDAAAAHADEYAQIRGHAALALTAADPKAAAGHVAKLKAVKATQPSSKALRKAALAKLSPG